MRRRAIAHGAAATVVRAGPCVIWKPRLDVVVNCLHTHEQEGPRWRGVFDLYQELKEGGCARPERLSRGLVRRADRQVKGGA
jgi:hypothetical protein